MGRIPKSTRLIILFSLLLLCSADLPAQQQYLPMMSGTEDGVHIVVRGRYSGFSGFLVYRKEAGAGNEYQLLTEEPIREIGDIYRAQEVLGSYWDYLKDFLNTSDPNEVLLRMKSPDVATILRYCGVPFAKVLGRHYYDGSAEWGEKYRYKIIVLNRTGNEIQSVEVDYRVTDTPPQHTTEIMFEQQKETIQLKWDAPVYVEDPEDDFVGFNLYRTYQGKTKRLNFLPILRRDQIVWFDETVTEEKTYEYRIKPVDIIGREGEVSARLSVYVQDLIAPLVPQGLSAEEGYGQIMLNWEPGIARDIVRYNIYRAASLKAQYSPIDSVDGTTTTYIDSAIIGGKPHFYKVQAYDNANNASLRSTAIYAVAKDSIAPPRPINIEYEVAGDNHSVILNWQKPSAPDLQGYFVSRGYRAGRAVKLTPESITETRFIDRQSFHPGHTYHYYISAIDLSFNQSGKSVVRVPIPDDEPPLPPKACSRSVTESGDVRIGWQPSMSLDVKAYRIYRAQDDQKEMISVVGGDTHSALDSTMIRGSEYVYIVTAIDSFNNESESVQSRPVTPRDILPPPKPRNLNIRIQEDGVSLTWDCSEAVDLQGFNIYRSRTRYGMMRKINETLLTHKQYIDTEGDQGYYYKVTSFDTSENETASEVHRAE